MEVGVARGMRVWLDAALAEIAASKSWMTGLAIDEDEERR